MAKEKNSVGRPSKYDEVVKPRLEDIKAWSEAGATNQEIAKVLNIAMSTFCEYQNKYPEFKEALSSRTRLNGVLEVKLALYKKAVGMEYEETKSYLKEDENGNKIYHTETYRRKSLPDNNAIAMYLRNYDQSYTDKDAITNKFKEQELELRKRSLENTEW